MQSAESPEDQMERARRREEGLENLRLINLYTDLAEARRNKDVDQAIVMACSAFIHLANALQKLAETAEALARKAAEDEEPPGR